MAKRKILICGDPILRRKAERVRQIDEQIRQLLEEMVETMLEAPGIGLAAPQIGISCRCIVVRDKADSEAERIYKLINPRVLARRGEQIGYEGCLSLPTLQAEVRRPQQIVVQAWDENGEPLRIEAEGLLARCILHEIDHLDGVLFIDRANPKTLAWMLPDENEEEGYRLEPTTVQEALAAFERLRQRQEHMQASEQVRQGLS